jgi:hypothetical protein
MLTLSVGSGEGYSRNIVREAHRASGVAVPSVQLGTPMDADHYVTERLFKNMNADKTKASVQCAVKNALPVQGR